MKIRGFIKSIITTAVVAAFMLQPVELFASAIEKNAEVNESNIISLLSEYDEDGEYIIQFGMENGDDILAWFNQGTTILDDITTAVHEELHEYILQKQHASDEEIYIGNKNSIHVEFTDVFDSQEMVSDIPTELQTFRFNNYIGEPKPDMASNKDGVYGLLNEFTAYCWGLNNTICLYDYYKSEANSDSDWLDYVNKLQNGRMAYSEFNFYILKYLAYAQANHPDIYEKIIANESFTEAYTTIEEKYRDLIETGDMYIEELLREKDGKIEDGFFYLGSSGISLVDKEYEKLIDEVSKKEYQDIFKAVGGTNSTKTVTASVAVKPSKAVTTVTSNRTNTNAAVTSATTYSYSSVMASMGTAKAKETSWLTVGNVVLAAMWAFLLIGIFIVLAELIKGGKKK